MPGPMPFHLEKGPWITELERFLNEDVDRAWELVERCRTEFDGAVSDFAGSPYLEGDPLYRSAPERDAHLRQHWFGYGEGRDHHVPFGHWLSQALEQVRGTTPLSEEAVHQPDAVHDVLAELTTDELVAIGRWPSTGFWRQYHGDVGAIVRQTLLSALEVSLGLPHGSQDRSDVTRFLPIEVFWKCPQPWFEGWVTWRLHRSTRDVGQVTVILATPGTGTPVLQSPLFGRNPEESPWTVAPGKNPTGPTTVEARSGSPEHRDRGMWVVTHGENLVLPAIPSNRPTRRGEWEGIIPSIGPSYAGVGPIQVVSPSWEDGGVPPSEPAPEQAASL